MPVGPWAPLYRAFRGPGALGQGTLVTLAPLGPQGPMGPVPGLVTFRCDLVAMPSLYNDISKKLEDLYGPAAVRETPHIFEGTLASLLDGPTGPHYPCVSLGCLWGPMVALEGPKSVFFGRKKTPLRGNAAP